MKNHHNSANDTAPQRRYGSEKDVFHLTGIRPRTLQKHRLFARGFPFYRVNGRIFYDLNEIQELIRAGRVNGGTAA